MLAELGVHFELGIEIDSAEALAAVAEDADAVVLAVGLGLDVDVRYPGDDLPGVWESLPFIEAIKTGRAARDRRHGLRDRRRQHRRRRRARGGPPRRRATSRCSTAAPRAEMPAYPHEVAEAIDEGVQVEWLTAPVRFIGSDASARQSSAGACSLGEPDASGTRAPGRGAAAPSSSCRSTRS